MRDGIPLTESSNSVLPTSGSQEKLTRGAYAQTKTQSRWKKWLWVGLAIAAICIAGIVVGVLFAKKVIQTGPATADSNSNAEAVTTGLGTTATEGAPEPTSTTDDSSATTTESSSTISSSSTPTPTACSTADDIPTKFRNTWMDPTTWTDMDGFNCTFTDAMVGELPLVGLNATWDDSKRANPNVPALNKPWGAYTARPVRGVNVGGWLSLEPFITPGLFNYPSSDGIIDEYTLCEHLGPEDAAKILENHYATFITEEDFKNIAAAGLDHIRIPFSYWAAVVYDNDPYVFGVSWRYLLRGIEWARKYGLRIKLDLHGLPGSQNGWNHSGHSSIINWILGDDGAANRKRSLDVHDRLSKFFAQDRYKNIIAFYGLANEPAKTIPTDDLVQWTSDVFKIVKDNGIEAPQVFSESMKGLPAWTGQLTGYGDSLIVDVHQYTIFDEYLIGLEHAEKIAFACKTYSSDLADSMGAGFGPTMVGEWSQADTDCTLHLNGVRNGARWNGTFFDNGPACPTKDERCDCGPANADPSTFTTEYKLFLQTWAEAQMSVFAQSWGYFYWTWKTENAPLWSYEAAWKGGFMPKLAYEPRWDCSKAIPSFGSLPEYY